MWDGHIHVCREATRLKAVLPPMQAYAWEKVPSAVLRTAQGTVFNAVALNKGFASHVELWNQIPVCCSLVG